MHIKIFNDTQEEEINSFIHSNLIQSIVTTADKIIIITVDAAEVE